MKEINNPDVKTWFICWNKNKENRITQGVVLPTQTMSTNIPVITKYITFNGWVKELSKSGMSNEEINKL